MARPAGPGPGATRAAPPRPATAEAVAVVAHAALVRLAGLDAAGRNLAGYRKVTVPVGSLRRLDPTPVE